tara:strand:+ start:318 stop:704 length:387 start_codon:yes stop_codon:yes gene_type:complete
MPILAATEDLYKTYENEVAGWLHSMSTEETPTEYIVNMLSKGIYECFFTFDGDRIIGIVITDSRVGILKFVGASGNVMGKWDVLHKQFVQLAKDKGLTSIEFRGRRGFLRTFKQYGMTEKFTVMEMKF